MPTSSISIFFKQLFLVPHFPITVPAHSPASCYCAVIVSSGYICFEIITAQVTQVIQLNIFLVNCMPSGSFNGKLRPWAWNDSIQVSLQQKGTGDFLEIFSKLFGRCHEIISAILNYTIWSIETYLSSLVNKETKFHVLISCFYPRPVLAFRYCHCMPVCVCWSVLCVQYSWASLLNNPSSPIETRITKFGSEV